MSQPPPQQVLRLPRAISWLVRPLPLMPLEMALGRLVEGILERHPDLVGRLAEDTPRRIAIAPSDLPFIIVLETGNANIALKLMRTRDTTFDACISGPLLALMGLVEGTYDGDALFFSRDLSIEGDMEAVLALRNAIDGADIDLLGEAAACLGTPAVPIAHMARRCIDGLIGTPARNPAPFRENAS